MLLFGRKKKKDTGLWGEEQAERLLRSKGYRILGRRVRLSARDEIDIVARDDETLVFVEVKTRRTEDFGRPLAAVDREKRRSLSRAAVRYLQRLKYPDVCFRFDVVEVVGRVDDAKPCLRHVENAFALGKKYRLP